MEIARIKKSPLSSVWPNEARDFTPWLADNLEYLSEDLGLGRLTLEDTEVRIPGGRSLDLLAVDELGRLVAIENQFGVLDHDHLTRGLAYAVGLDSTERHVAALVVVAEDHRDEFVAVAEYLNECADARGEKGIHVFLVVAETTQIADSPPAIQFRAVARPNEWEGAIRAARDGQLADEDALYSLLHPEEARVARGIVDGWSAIDGTSRVLAKRSITLFVRNDVASRSRTNVGAIELNHGGVFMIAVERISSSRRLPTSAVDELRRRVESFGEPAGSGSGHFPSFRLDRIDVQLAVDTLQWVAGFFD